MKKWAYLLFLFPASVSASFMNMAGMETGDTSEFVSVSGTAVGSTTSVVYTGTYSLRINPTTNGTATARLGTLSAAGVQGVSGTNASTGCATFQFQYLTKPASGAEQFLNFESAAGTTKLALRLNSAGQTVVYDSVPTALSTGTTVLNSGTWYQYDVCVGSGTSAYYTLSIGSVFESSGTGNMLATGTDIIRFGKNANRSSQSIDFYYDDMVFSSATITAHGVIKIMVPSANGTNQKYTVGVGAGSHYQIVNPVPSLGDASYLVSTLVTTDTETEKMQTTASAGVSGTINCIRAGNIEKQDGASGGVQTIRVVSGATTFGGTGAPAIGAAYTLRTFPLENDPNTSAAWTIAGLDAIEVGAKEGSAVNKSRLTSVFVTVHYTPTTSGQNSFFYIQ